MEDVTVPLELTQIENWSRTVDRLKVEAGLFDKRAMSVQGDTQELIVSLHGTVGDRAYTKNFRSYRLEEIETPVDLAMLLHDLNSITFAWMPLEVYVNVDRDVFYIINASALMQLIKHMSVGGENHVSISGHMGEA